MKSLRIFCHSDSHFTSAYYICIESFVELYKNVKFYTNLHRNIIGGLFNYRVIKMLRLFGVWSFTFQQKRTDYIEIIIDLIAFIILHRKKNLTLFADHAEI